MTEIDPATWCKEQWIYAITALVSIIASVMIFGFESGYAPFISIASPTLYFLYVLKKEQYARQKKQSKNEG